MAVCEKGKGREIFCVENAALFGEISSFPFGPAAADIRGLCVRGRGGTVTHRNTVARQKADSPTRRRSAKKERQRVREQGESLRFCACRCFFWGARLAFPVRDAGFSRDFRPAPSWVITASCVWLLGGRVISRGASANTAPPARSPHRARPDRPFRREKHRLTRAPRAAIPFAGLGNQNKQPWERRSFT